MILYNNFDGGPNGTTLTTTNSGQIPGNNAFDGVSVPGSGSVIQFSSAFSRPTAEYVLLCSTSTTDKSTVAYWMTALGGTPSQVWMRLYMYIVTLPNYPADRSIWETQHLTLGKQALIGIIGNKLLCMSSASGQRVDMVTNLVTGAWVRIECRIQHSATTGNGELRYYVEADAPVDDYTEAQAFSGWNLRSSVTEAVLYGFTGVYANQGPMYLSNVAVSDEDWVGPAPFRAGKGVPGILSNPIAVHTNIA